MHIEIDVKREASASIVLNNLFNLTQLQTTFGAIMLAIVDGVPKVLNLKQMLQNYVQFYYRFLHHLEFVQYCLLLVVIFVVKNQANVLFQ